MLPWPYVFCVDGDEIVGVLLSEGSCLRPRAVVLLLCVLRTTSVSENAPLVMRVPVRPCKERVRAGRLAWDRMHGASPAAVEKLRALPELWAPAAGSGCRGAHRGSSHAETGHPGEGEAAVGGLFVVWPVASGPLEGRGEAPAGCPVLIAHHGA